MSHKNGRPLDRELEAALDRKTRDLEDRASHVGALTRASLRSLRLGTPPRSAIESTSDEDEDDLEAASARFELERKRSQLEYELKRSQREYELKRSQLE